MALRRLHSLSVAALLVTLISLPAWSASLDDRAGLQAFIDGVMATSMKEHHVAGAVVGITRTGETLVLAGYGHANLADEVVVSSETTLFRVGSVTKPFVWVAIMKLVQEGRLDLDADVNTYLDDIQIPDTYPEPITLKHLMTHTPGFEDRVMGLFARDAESLVPLKELLSGDGMPKRVRPPGVLPSYSNHGVAIAGLIIENVTGLPWEDYVEQNILDPLGMNHATMKQPLPESIAADMSNGYAFRQGRFEVEGFEFVPPSPAGSASASGNDMLKFARFLLGNPSGRSVLNDTSRQALFEQLFLPMANINGINHGLYDTGSHGQRIVGHGGDTIWFHSELAIFPKQDLAFFISTNSETGPEVRGAFVAAFMDRYFPAEKPVPLTVNERTDLSRVVGEYGTIRHSHTDATKLINLMGPIVVAPNETGDGILLMGPLDPGNPSRLIETAPGVFEDKDSSLKIGFKLEDGQPASHLYINSAQVMAFERLQGANSPGLNNFILTATLLTFLWILIRWPYQHFRDGQWREPSEGRFRLVGWLMSATFVVFAVTVMSIVEGPSDVVFGLGSTVMVVKVFAWLLVAFTVAMAAAYAGVVTDNRVTTGVRIRTAWVLLVACLFTWFLYYWQFL